MTSETKYIRRGKLIYTIKRIQSENGIAFVNRVSAQYKSVEAAKRESHRLKNSC